MKPSIDFKPFKKAIKTTVESSGIPVSVEYSPSRVITQVLGHIADDEPLVPMSELNFNVEFRVFDDLGHFRGISDNIADASMEESRRLFEDYLKFLALLTDQEVLEDVVSKAPRNKNGHLTANRVVFRYCCAGMRRDGTYYCVQARSEKGDRIVIKPYRELLEWAVHPDELFKIDADLLGQYESVENRLGFV